MSNETVKEKLIGVPKIILMEPKCKQKPKEGFVFKRIPLEIMYGIQI
jgi:hypothetical protein